MKEDRRRRLKTQLALNSLNARRKRVLNFACLLLLLISQRNITVPRPVCTCRRLKRNTGCWENVCNTSSKERFKKTFRVSPKTFIFILNCIEPFPIRQTVNRQRSAKPEACYFFLYRLGRRDYLYTMTMSGLAISTVSSICQEVCQVLADHLWKETVSSHMLQTEEGFKQKILDMEQFWQFPRCWTAINGYHIPMECSPGGLQACKEYHHFPLLFYVWMFAFLWWILV